MTFEMRSKLLYMKCLLNINIILYTFMQNNSKIYPWMTVLFARQNHQCTYMKKLYNDFGWTCVTLTFELEKWISCHTTSCHHVQSIYGFIQIWKKRSLIYENLEWKSLKQHILVLQHSKCPWNKTQLYYSNLKLQKHYNYHIQSKSFTNNLWFSKGNLNDIYNLRLSA
jgi:hypothetical protein